MTLKCPLCYKDLEMTDSIDHNIGEGYYIKEDYECRGCRALFYHAVKVSPQGRWDKWFRVEPDHSTTEIEIPLPKAA